MIHPVMKKVLLTTVPTLLIALSFFSLCLAPFGYRDISTFFVIAYISSLAFLAAWVYYDFASLLLLMAGFAAAPLPLFIFEYFEGGFLQYFFTMIVAMFYSLPFVVLTIVVAAVKRGRSS